MNPMDLDIEAMIPHRGRMRLIETVMAVDDQKARTAATGRAASLRQREWLLRDGRTVEVTVRRRADGSCVALHEDVTEQRRVAAQLTHLARHDALTGLANRQVLIEHLELQLPRTRRGEAMAVLCLSSTFTGAAGYTATLAAQYVGAGRPRRIGPASCTATSSPTTSCSRGWSGTRC